MNRVNSIPFQEACTWEMIKKIPISECNENLIPFSNSEKLIVDPIYYKNDIPHAMNKCLGRKSVIDKLNLAINFLPENLGIVVLDAWRSREVQKELNLSIGKIVKDRYPNLSTEEQKKVLMEFVAPSDPSFISPHLTGGSVDVTLYDFKNQQHLNMGSDFDEPTKISYTRAYENLPKHEAHINRRILYNAMIAAGFTNLETEWWHYDYGNQLWACHSKNNSAIYGSIQP